MVLADFSTVLRTHTTVCWTTMGVSVHDYSRALVRFLPFLPARANIASAALHYLPPRQIALDRIHSNDITQ
jgi:hypothetical protein